MSGKDKNDEAERVIAKLATEMAAKTSWAYEACDKIVRTEISLKAAKRSASCHERTSELLRDHLLSRILSKGVQAHYFSLSENGLDVGYAMDDAGSSAQVHFDNPEPAFPAKR